jgi:hypothetical protein
MFYANEANAGTKGKHMTMMIMSMWWDYVSELRPPPSLLFIPRWYMNLDLRSILVQSYMRPTALFTIRRRACCGFLSSLKIRRPRPGLNPWTLDPCFEDRRERTIFLHTALRRTALEGAGPDMCRQLPRALRTRTDCLILFVNLIDIWLYEHASFYAEE